MGEKLQKFANAPHKFFAMLAGKISSQNPQNKTGKVFKVIGLSLTQITRFLTWATKYAVLDSHLIRVLEKEFESIKNIKNKEGQEIAIKKILKKHPTVMALLIDWMLIGGMVGVGAAAVTNRKDNKEDKKENKKEVVINKIDKDNIADTVNSSIDVYFPSVFIGLSELETYRSTPKLHQGEKRYTYYLGLTWVYERGANDKVIQHECIGQWKDKAARFTDRECQEQLKMHLEYELFKKVKTAYKSIDVANDYKVIVGLLLAGYQRSSDIKEIVQLLSVAKNSQDVADAFTCYKGSKKWKNGTLKRRWICAAYAVGAIDDNDLLNMRMDAFANLKIDTYCRRDNNGKLHFNLDPNTVSKVLSVQSKNRFVRDFVGPDIINNMPRVPKTVDFMFIKDMENNNTNKHFMENLKIVSFNKGIKKLQGGESAKYNAYVEFLKSEHKDV